MYLPIVGRNPLQTRSRRLSKVMMDFNNKNRSFYELRIVFKVPVVITDHTGCIEVWTGIISIQNYNKCLIRIPELYLFIRTTRI